MADCDIFVLPSLAETFGIVLIEALAAGLRIVTTQSIPGRSGFNDDFVILVPPADVRALRHAVAEALDENWSPPRTEIEELAMSYSASVVAQRWNDMYRRVAAGRC
jgi:glycosyltransferase involved in cell wall biosynthesis